MTHSAIAVFTGKSVETILSLGGSQSWLLSLHNARQQSYLVCVRNSRSKDPGVSEPHGSAFLVGEISGLMALPAEQGVPRWRIKVKRYALIDKPDVWRGWRNPVRYTALEDLGISLEELHFLPLPETGEMEGVVTPPPAEAVLKLTIAQAKQGLAAMFGVAAEAVEITIKG